MNQYEQSKSVRKEDQKELPSAEYSLKSISWHLKCLVEEFKRMNDTLSRKEGAPF